MPPLVQVEDEVEGDTSCPAHFPSLSGRVQIFLHTDEDLLLYDRSVCMLAHAEKLPSSLHKVGNFKQAQYAAAALWHDVICTCGTHL